MGQIRGAGRNRPLSVRRGCAGNPEEYGRSVRSIEMMIYRQGLHRREKSSADDRAKLDCMPDPFEWMGGKKNLQKTV